MLFEETMRYPMLLLFFALAAGIVAESTVQASATLWAGAGAACLAVAAVLHRTPTRRVLLLVCMAVLGLLRGGAEREFPEWLVLRAPGISEVTGTVVSYPSLGADRIRFVVQPDRLPARILVTWSCPGGAAGRVHYGDCVGLAGRTERPGTFDGFDYGQYLERQGIVATMWVEFQELSILGVRPGVLRAGDQLRQTLLGSLRQRLTPAEFALAQSYVFGDRYALSDETEEAFARTGLMHILAVSGMHLTILLAGVWWALRALNVRPAVAYLLLAVVVLAAVWIIGPWVSFVRSALLFFFVAAGSVLADLGLILRSSVRPMNALAAAAFVLLLVEPQYLFDVGFQLSVAATAGLLLFAPRPGWPAFPRLPRPLARASRAGTSLLFVSLAAQAGAAPILAVQFEKLQIWTAVTGMVAIPLSSVALWFGIVALAVTPLAFLAGIAARIFGWSLQAFESVVVAAARLPWSTVPTDGRVGIWLASLVGLLYVAREVLARPAVLVAPGGFARWTPESTPGATASGVSMAEDLAITDNGRSRLTGGRRGPSLLHHDAHGEGMPDRAQSDSSAYAEAGEAVARALRVVPRGVVRAGRTTRLRSGLLDARGSDRIGAQRRSDR
jgi:ComEC/Rec2-related protein